MDYLERVNKYYIRLNNKARDKKDALVSNLESTPEGKERLTQLRNKYHNESLEDFVTYSKEADRILEYNGHLYQKLNPIYMDPLFKFVKAHFYAPRKMLFNEYYSTFWVNIGIIWMMTILLYFILYFRLLKKLLDYVEQLSERFSKNN